jgi:hypothetical protein
MGLPGESNRINRLIRGYTLMKTRLKLAVVLIAMLPAGNVGAKPRLIVLTDIGGDPDDRQSMIRLMLYSNEFEIEGLIASASGTPGELGKAVVKPHLIEEIVNAYGENRTLLRRLSMPMARFATTWCYIVPDIPQLGIFWLE